MGEWRGGRDNLHWCYCISISNVGQSLIMYQKAYEDLQRMGFQIAPCFVNRYFTGSKQAGFPLMAFLTTLSMVDVCPKHQQLAYLVHGVFDHPILDFSYINPQFPLSPHRSHSRVAKYLSSRSSQDPRCMIFTFLRITATISYVCMITTPPPLLHLQPQTHNFCGQSDNQVVCHKPQIMCKSSKKPSECPHWFLWQGPKLKELAWDPSIQLP